MCSTDSENNSINTTSFETIGLPDSEDEGTMTLRNVVRDLPLYIA
jgi:hypothetical protein